MAVDFAKLKDVNDLASRVLALNEKIKAISPAGTQVVLDGVPDFSFPSTNGLITLYTNRRDDLLQQIRAIVNA